MKNTLKYEVYFDRQGHILKPYAIRDKETGKIVDRFFTYPESCKAYDRKYSAIFYTPPN